MENGNALLQPQIGNAKKKKVSELEKHTPVLHPVGLILILFPQSNEILEGQNIHRAKGQLYFYLIPSMSKIKLEQ